MAKMKGLKEGLTYISSKTGQFRYADTAPTDSGSGQFLYNERWLHPLSRYKAAVAIKRGEPLSVASMGELSTTQASDPDSFVIQTDPYKHKKCIGLAMNSAAAGEMVQILGHGTFEIWSSATSTEHYLPDFLSENYADVIGKTIYITGNKQDLLNKKWFTLKESDAYLVSSNIIQVGHITDLNNNSLPKLIVEVDLEGDGRGLYGTTQFDGFFQSVQKIPADKPLRVYGSRVSDQLIVSYFKCHGKMKFETAFGNSISQQNSKGIIGLKNTSDVNTPQVVYSILEGPYTDSNNNDAVFKNGDTTVIANANSNLFIAENQLQVKDKYNLIIEIIRKIANGFTNKFYTLPGDATSTDILSFTANPTIIEYKDASTAQKLMGFSLEFDLAFTKRGGPFSIYASPTLSNSIYFEQSTIQEGYFYQGDQVYNDPQSGKNFACLEKCDCRFGNSQYVFGLYFGGQYGVDLNPAEKHLFINRGEMELDPGSRDGTGKPFIPGQTYYLGTNGEVVLSNYVNSSWRQRIGWAKTSLTFIVDIGTPEAVTLGSEPMGFIKPATRVTQPGNVLVSDPEYILIDSTKTYNLNQYSTTFKDYLLAKDLITITGATFKFKYSTTINNQPAQIRHTDTFVSPLYQIAPYESFNGFFKANPNASAYPKIIPDKTVFNVNALIQAGPIYKDANTINNPYQMMELLDIKFLYRDINVLTGEETWSQIPEGFFLYNNNQKFGYRWVLGKPDHANQDQWFITMDFGDGYGPAIISGNGSSPKLFDSSTLYRILVYRRNLWQYELNIENVITKYVDNQVSADSQMPISGKAVFEFFHQDLELKNLFVYKSVYIGPQASYPEVANNNLAELNTKSKLDGPTVVLSKDIKLLGGLVIMPPFEGNNNPPAALGNYMSLNDLSKGPSRDQLFPEFAKLFFDSQFNGTFKPPVPIPNYNDLSIYGHPLAPQELRQNSWLSYQDSVVLFPLKMEVDKFGFLIYEDSKEINSEKAFNHFLWFHNPLYPLSSFKNNYPSNYFYLKSNLFPNEITERSVFIDHSKSGPELIKNPLIPLSALLEHSYASTEREIIFQTSRNESGDLINKINTAETFAHNSYFAPHGLVQGIDGSISSSTLGGIKLGWDSSTKARSFLHNKFKKITEEVGTNNSPSILLYTNKDFRFKTNITSGGTFKPEPSIEVIVNELDDLQGINIPNNTLSKFELYKKAYHPSFIPFFIDGISNFENTFFIRNYQKQLDESYQSIQALRGLRPKKPVITKISYSITDTPKKINIANASANDIVEYLRNLPSGATHYGKYYTLKLRATTVITSVEKTVTIILTLKPSNQPEPLTTYLSDEFPEPTSISFSYNTSQTGTASKSGSSVVTSDSKIITYTTTLTSSITQNSLIVTPPSFSTRPPVDNVEYKVI